jgi:hypothetical protein
LCTLCTYLDYVSLFQCVYNIDRRTFDFSTRIWLPQNWSVHKRTGDDVEPVATVIDDDSFVYNTANWQNIYEVFRFSVFFAFARGQFSNGFYLA